MNSFLYTPQFWIPIILVVIYGLYRIVSAHDRRLEKEEMRRVEMASAMDEQRRLHKQRWDARQAEHIDRLDRINRAYGYESQGGVRGKDMVEKRKMTPEEAQKLRRQYPLERECIGSDYDIDHTTQELQARTIATGTACSWSAACEDAIQSKVPNRFDLHLSIEREGYSYRWRLERRQGEVELPRKTPGVKIHPWVMPRGLEDDSQVPDLVEEAKWWPPSLDDNEQKRQEKTHDVINRLIQYYKKAGYIKNAKSISDGYHTFQELYDMRLALTIALFRSVVRCNHVYSTMQKIGQYGVYRSRQHSDGTMFEGMFIVLLSIDYPNNSKWISFHYHDEHWDKFEFCSTLDKAPEWDGHTDKDVTERLLAL